MDTLVRIQQGALNLNIMETINNLTFELTENNIRILQSFNIHKIEMYKFIKVFKNKYPKHNVSQISTFLLICE